MMNRNTLYLLGVLVLLALGAFFLMQRPGEQSVDPSDRRTITAIDSASIDGIRITSPTASITLEKKGAEWIITQPLEYRADQGAVATLLERLGTASAKTLISSKPEKQSLFEVDTSGLTVAYSRNGIEEGALVIGKTGPDYSDVYVRMLSSSNIYLTDGALAQSARLPLKNWRDRAIVKIPSETVKEVHYQYGDTTFAVAWKDSVWMVDSKAANGTITGGVLRSLCDLQTDEFLDIPPSKLKIVAVITFAGIELRFSQAPGNDKYVVQSSLSPQLFELQSWRANQILKRKRDFEAQGS